MSPTGTITLMGSGELTASMVEIHKMLIAALPASAHITFVDTPAGFQPNADQISAGAVDYFKNRVRKCMGVASYKSHQAISEIDAALALQRLRESHYILMGPGSPTYTINQFQPTPIPAILEERIRAGGCLTAASAAALTVGCYTLPVYEIYKVGQPLHWVRGLDLLAQFGLNLVVVPHWNNAEGGTHDTSRCFMGRERFEKLLEKLDEPIPILGLDEHTACIINLTDDIFQVRGIGGVELLSNGNSRNFKSGESYPLDLLRSDATASDQAEPAFAIERLSASNDSEDESENGADFWKMIYDFEAQCRAALTTHNDNEAVAALLELDRVLWEAPALLNNPDTLAEARFLFRELIVLIGTRSRLSGKEMRRALEPMVEKLLEVRQQLRLESNWSAADTIREALACAGIAIEDTGDGTHWRFSTLQGVSNDQSS